MSEIETDRTICTRYNELRMSGIRYFDTAATMAKEFCYATEYMPRRIRRAFQKTGAVMWRKKCK
jgi:hypothetical protein